MKDKITITIFQDYKTNIIKYKEYFDDIILIKDVIGHQNCILEVNGDILIKNYIGTFSTDRISLQVLPKIYDFKIIDKSNEIKKSLDFIYRLLIWSNYFSFKTMNATISINDDSSLLEIIINIFINEFLSLYRKNIYREYIDIEKEEVFLKGKVLFQKSIDYKPSRLFKKYVQYDDLTENNKINQTIKATITKLLSFAKNIENKKLLRQGLKYLEDVDTIILDYSIFKNLNFNRINKPYKPIIDLAKMFFNKTQPGLAAGEQDLISFSVQLNMLYEYFIKSLLEKIYKYDLIVKYHNCDYLAKDSYNNNKFRLEPDFSILNKEFKTLMILDTKFKNPINSEGNLKIKSSDVYQMCAYAIKFLCKSIVLIYPYFQGGKVLENNHYKIINGTDEIIISIMQINLFNKDVYSIEHELREKLHTIHNSL